MKKIFISLSFIATSILFGCNNPSESTYIAKELTGKIVIRDTLNDVPEKYTKDVLVLIGDYSITKDEYYYSTKTNENGEFKFTHRPDKSLCILAKYIDTNGVAFESKIHEITKDNSTISQLVAYPTKDNTGIKIKVSEKNTPINNAKVYVYVSKSVFEVNRQALSDSISKKKTDNITGFVKDLTTGNIGTAYWPKPLPATYYLLIKTTIGADRFTKDTIINFDNHQVFVPIKFK